MIIILYYYLLLKFMLEIVLIFLVSYNNDVILNTQFDLILLCEHKMCKLYVTNCGTYTYSVEQYQLFSNKEINEYIFEHEYLRRHEYKTELYAGVTDAFECNNCIISEITQQKCINQYSFYIYNNIQTTYGQH